MKKNVTATPRPLKGLLLPSLYIAALSIFVIAAQSAGLVSMVEYVTSRKGWDAQKEQFSAVSSEWAAITEATRSSIDEAKKLELEAQRNRLAAEKEFEAATNKLVASQGELDAIQAAATIAIESQREAKAQEQISFERSKTLDAEIENLRSKKQELMDAINVANQDLATIQSKLSENRTLLDLQEKELKSNSSRLTQLESTFKTTRDELKTTREELVKATEDLTSTVIARRTSAAAIENASEIKKEVESLKSEKAKLTGENSSLATQRSELEQNLANADSRISVAEKKLADYLSKWNNRDKINQEIDQLLDRVKTLKQTESDTVANISRLNDQSVKQETKVKSLADEIKLAQEQLTELKEEQKKILTSLIELQKQRREAEETSKKEPPKQEGGNSPNE